MLAMTRMSHTPPCMLHALHSRQLLAAAANNRPAAASRAWQDYLFRYKAGIEAVTPEDILAAARRHLHPGQQAVVMAADASVFQPRLEAAGMRVVPMVVD